MRSRVVVAGICLAALVGCASNATDDPGQPTPPTPPGSAPGPVQPTSGGAVPPTTIPAEPSGPSESEMTITGTVTVGVEAGCLLLDGYLLVGGDRDIIRGGARVTVTGRVDTDLMTTCQQGTPFVVTSARPA